MRIGTARHLMFVGLLSTVAARTHAADWPCWRGPARNGVSVEKDWNPASIKSGAKKLWTTDIGAGFSTVAVVKDRVFTFGNKSNRDIVQCLESDTGKLVWQHSYACDSGSYPGPRSSPTVHEGAVFTFSREGLLNCLDAKTGEPIWTRKTATTLAAAPLSWGFACSPYIQGDALVMNIHSHGLALDRKTGNTLWTSPPGKSGYASPVPFSQKARPCVAVFSPSALCGVDIGTGTKLWAHPWKTKHEANAADPLIAGNRIFVSTSYGRGCALLDISGETPRVLWENRTMQNHTSTSVLVNDCIYGFSGDLRQKTKLVCIDAGTGGTTWAHKLDRAGSLIAADGKLIILTGKGDLLIVPASPVGYSELARARVITDEKCWSAPVLANGRIYCRGNAGSLVCVDVR